MALPARQERLSASPRHRSGSGQQLRARGWVLFVFLSRVIVAILLQALLGGSKWLPSVNVQQNTQPHARPQADPGLSA